MGCFGPDAAIGLDSLEQRAAVETYWTLVVNTPEDLGIRSKHGQPQSNSCQNEQQSLAVSDHRYCSILVSPDLSLHA